MMEPMEPTSSATAVGWWEDEDQLNQMAAFLEPRSIGAVACTCRFARDNLRDANALRWLAQLRGLDVATTCAPPFALPRFTL